MVSVGAGLPYLGAPNKFIVQDQNATVLIPSDQFVDLGYYYHGQNYRYYQEYTDVQIQALENLIKSILSRWPAINNHIRGNNLYEWVFGFHRSFLDSKGIPKPDVFVKSLTAGNSGGSDSEYDYTRNLLGGGGGYLGPKGWNVGGFNVQGGMYAHATGGGSHYDVAPTPKLVDMLVRLGYKKGW